MPYQWVLVAAAVVLTFAIVLMAQLTWYSWRANASQRRAHRRLKMWREAQAFDPGQRIES